MIPEVMYHGTFSMFEEFDIRMANSGAYCGPGVYLTSEVADATDFYADENSGDTRAKIHNLADELFREAYQSYGEVLQIAQQKICGEKSYILTCKPKVSNPIVLAKYRSKGTYIELWTYDPEDEDAEPEPTEAYYSISAVLNNYNIRFYPEDAEIAAEDLYQLCGDNWMDECTPGELFQEIAKELGFDSILMKDVETYFPMYRGLYGEFDHLIIFSPNNVEILNREER